MSKPKLDRKSVRSLPKGGRITENGITAEKLQDGVEGDVRFTVNLMVNRVRHHRIIGKASGGWTIAKAQIYAETIRTREREGRLDLPTGRKLHRSFKEASREYLERLDQTGGKNLVPKRRHLGSKPNQPLENLRAH